MEKQLLTDILNTLLLADFTTTSITYKLVMLLIKRRKFLVKLSESILYETDVCFKRKKYRREIWVFWSEHSRKWEIYFVFCVTEHLRHMACSVIEINICSQDLQEIIIYKTIKKRLYCNQQSETIIIFHVSMRKPVLQICADRPILGVEFQISQNKHTRIPGLWTQVLNAGLWTLDSGRWTLDPGCWALDAGLWSLDSGRWDAGCYTLDAGLWALDTIIDCFKTKSEASFWLCLIILWVRISIVL